MTEELYNAIWFFVSKNITSINESITPVSYAIRLFEATHTESKLPVNTPQELRIVEQCFFDAINEAKL